MIRHKIKLLKSHKMFSTCAVLKASENKCVLMWAIKTQRIGTCLISSQLAGGLDPEMQRELEELKKQNLLYSRTTQKADEAAKLKNWQEPREESGECRTQD